VESAEPAHLFDQLRAEDAFAAEAGEDLLVGFGRSPEVAREQVVAGFGFVISLPIDP
jgi:hypothetical protein